MLQARTESSAAPLTRKSGVLVKFEICDRVGKRLHDGRLNGEFPNRRTAVQEIKLHLQQFERAGYDRMRRFWWGRSLSGPCEETRFFVK